MAVGANTVWRVRPGGNNANGSGYDSTISGAGTDYTQQDAAQLSVTDIACSATTTVTSATGGFTSAMIGNAIRITGGGSASGYYFITGRTDTNTITVDRTPGTVSGGTGKVGGAAATLGRILESGNSTGDKVVAGNTIYVRGSGSNNPGTADYTYTSYINPVGGSSSAGCVDIIGENGRPRFDGSGIELLFANPTYCRINNLYIKAGSAVHSRLITTNDYVSIRNCVFHLNDLNIDGVRIWGTHNTITGNEFLSSTGTPTSRSSVAAINAASGGSPAHSCVIAGNTFYKVGGEAITAPGMMMIIVRNLIALGATNGINFTSASYNGIIYGNIIDGNGGDGIRIASSAVQQPAVWNNVISNHTGVGKYGLNIVSGSTSLVDKLARLIDYNAFYNNTGNYANISAGANDQVLGSTPYTQGNAPTTDWSLNTLLKAKGFPSAMPSVLSGVAMSNYEDIGLQRQEAGAGGGGLLVHPGMVGGCRG